MSKCECCGKEKDKTYSINGVQLTAKQYYDKSGDTDNYVKKEMCKKKEFINERKTIAWCQDTTLDDVDGVKEMLKEYAVNKGYNEDDVMVEVTEFIDVFIFHLVEKEETEGTHWITEGKRPY
jgi:stalled ribosome rescue protein Dom34